jgi:hypothetical protein
MDGWEATPTTSSLDERPTLPPRIVTRCTAEIYDSRGLNMNAIRKIILNGLGLASLFGAMSPSPLQAQLKQDESPLGEYHERLRRNEPGRLLGEWIEEGAYVPNWELDPYVQEKLQNRLQKQLLTQERIQKLRQAQARILSTRQHQAFLKQDREEQRLLAWEARKHKEQVWQQDREERRSLAQEAHKRQELAKQDREEHLISKAGRTVTHDPIDLSNGIDWPPALVTPENKEMRRRIQVLAFRHFEVHAVGEELTQAIRDLDADLRKRVAEIRPGDYVRAKRFLTELVEEVGTVVSSDLAIK